MNTYPAPYAHLIPKLCRADSLRTQINALKDRDPSLWDVIVQRLRVDWTYHSNGIEGSTLTRGETHFLLAEGLTVEGKPFKDFLDARNHADAIDLLFEVVAGQQPITEHFIKEINALILFGVNSTPAQNALGQRVRKLARPGQYKGLPNHVLQPDGTIHTYVDPLHVPDHMQELVSWISSATPAQHPVHVAAVAHYNMVRIHPFDDGNGRGARILMNLILMKAGYFPAVVRLETKRRYLEALSAGDQGDLFAFVEFVADTVIASNELVLQTLTHT